MVGIPIVAGLAFELIKWFGKNRTKRWARILMWPGIQLQRLTTREPDLSQLAVAIAALEAVLAVENPRAGLRGGQGRHGSRGVGLAARRSRKPLDMGAVLLTGATGFVGMEILSRFLERGDRHIFALVRADNDDQAAERLPAHDRLTAVAGDIEQPELGLADGTRELLRREVTTVLHCAASVSFDLPLEESRA